MHRLLYADWLEERRDPRGEFVRLHQQLRVLAPDHPRRVPLEHELSTARKGCAAEWLALVEPERAERFEPTRTGDLPECECLERKNPPAEPRFHLDAQDTECAPATRGYISGPHWAE